MSKDYYEILGVRPTASQQEIDLAFKGRRSQYHPDRYPGADASTVAWATAMMQEVNEAHATLSDPAARFHYDRTRQPAGEARRAAEDQHEECPPEDHEHAGNDPTEEPPIARPYKDEDPDNLPSSSELATSAKSSLFSYFDLKQATRDVGDAWSAKSKAVAGAKLLGKTLFNVGLFAAKTAPAIAAKEMERHLETRTDLTDEQRERMENFVSRHKKDDENE